MGGKELQPLGGANIFFLLLLIIFMLSLQQIGIRVKQEWDKSMSHWMKIGVGCGSGDYKN